jgi:predicted Zn-dependent protease
MLVCTRKRVPTMLRTLRSLCLLLLAALAAPALLAQEGAPPAGPPLPPAMVEALSRLETGDREGAIRLLEPLRASGTKDPRPLAMLGALYVEATRFEDALRVLRPLADYSLADPGVLYNAGRAALAAGDEKAGELYLLRSTAREPLSPAARELGLHYGRLGRNADAFNMLYRWAKLRPEDAEARMAAAQAGVRVGRPVEAREMVEGLNAASEPVRVLRASIAELEGKPELVLTELGALVVKPPMGLERETRLLAGRALLETNRPGEALRVLQGGNVSDPLLALYFAKALSLTGQNPAAVAALAPFVAYLGKLEAGKQPPPYSGEILTDHALALAASEKPAEAITSLETGLKVVPSHAPAWAALADLLKKAGRAVDARKAQARADQLAARTGPAIVAPGDPLSERIYEALDLVNRDKVNEAIALLRQQATVYPQDPRPHLLLARLFLAQRNTVEALREAEAGVKIAPQSADALYQRGAVKMAAKTLPAAEADFRAALEKNPSHVASLNDLAVLLMQKNDFAGAQTLLERALAASPTDQLALNNLRELAERRKAKP